MIFQDLLRRRKDAQPSAKLAQNMQLKRNPNERKSKVNNHTQIREVKKALSRNLQFLSLQVFWAIKSKNRKKLFQMNLIEITKFLHMFHFGEFFVEKIINTCSIDLA